MPDYWYDHIHLFSPDPEKTARFYEGMFNAKRVATTELPDGRTSIALDLNGSRILVIGRPAQAASAPASSGDVSGLDHFGIATDNLEAAVADLKAQGVEFRDEIRAIGSSIKISFLWAPDNVLIELLERSE